MRVVVEAGGGEGYEGCGEEHGSAYSHDVGEQGCAQFVGGCRG